MDDGSGPDPFIATAAAGTIPEGRARRHATKVSHGGAIVAVLILVGGLGAWLFWPA